MTATPGRLLALPLIGLVRLYQLTLSPLLPPVCRYYPSCSAYGLTSLQRFGALRGGYLTAHRLLRCNPWSRGGVDHVPDTWAERGSPELTRPRLGDPGGGTDADRDLASNPHGPAAAPAAAPVAGSGAGLGADPGASSATDRRTSIS